MLRAVPEVPRLLRAGRPHRASCQPAAVLVATDGHMCPRLSAQRTAPPGLGELRSTGALKPLLDLWMPWPSLAPQLLSYQLHWLLAPHLVERGCIPLCSQTACALALLLPSGLSLNVALITLSLGVLVGKCLDNDSTYFTACNSAWFIVHAK